ncbi:MAG TPA: serine hydrolase domain-containing protein [Bacteroidales bacterium]|nr:serine hydrolase domain-containing protein [Bacteroidales bacterium]
MFSVLHVYKSISQFTKHRLFPGGIVLLFLLCCSSQINPVKEGNCNYENAIRFSQHYLKQLIKETGTIGVAVTVIDSDNVVYSEGFGYADLKAGKVVTDSTTFMIGSTSKLFTATAVMQLVEQGRICLDSPITAYLPEFKVKSRFNARQINIRDLLTHESGLPSDILNGQMIGDIRGDGADTMYRTVASICENEYVANSPRTVFSYSNIGFSLLGTIIERVSKRSYAEYIQDSIFQKLGMKHSAVGFDDKKVKATFSRGYIGEKEENPLYIRDIPAGSIVSSVADFPLFVRMLFCGGTFNNAHILNENTLQQMWTPQNSDIPLDFYPIGLCYWLLNQTFIAERIISHEGTIPPFYTIFAALPDSRLGIVLTVNSEQGSVVPEKAGYKILEHFYQTKTGEKISEPKFPAMKTKKISAKRLNQIAGFYQTREGTVKMQIKEDNLQFFLSGMPVRLLPLSDSTFLIQYRLFDVIPIPRKQFKGMVMEFHSIGKHEIILLRSKGIITGYFGEKFIPETPPPEWLQRTGSYEIINERKAVFTNKENEKRYRISNITLAFDSASQVLSLNGVPLKILSSSDAVTCGYGRNANETVRAFNCDGEEHLWAWGFELKRIL